MKIATVPLNPRVGDISQNLQKIVNAIDKAIAQKCQMIIFPEMATVGYPPKDLIFLDALYHYQNHLLKILKTKSKKIAIIIGGYTKNKGVGPAFFNSAFLLQNGQKFIYNKQLLPNYDVFDENRYFQNGSKNLSFKMGRYKFGISICEDIWFDEPKLKKRYAQDPLSEYLNKKIQYLINISASPFEIFKNERKINLLKKKAKKLKTNIIYVNQCGANDDLIFDGEILLIEKTGKVTLKSKRFCEDIFIIDLTKTYPTLPDVNYDSDFLYNELEQALVLGIKDYIQKTNHKEAVLGLSGGIDSALVAHLAVKAIGSENVTGILMPSPHSSQGSIDDATSLAQNLKIKTHTIPIKSWYQNSQKTLIKAFKEKNLKSLTDQNLQARIRGQILMAFANQTGAMLLNTTNKSEMAMGYGTLYGDMNGALSVIIDLTKDHVYGLAKHMNPKFQMIPKASFTKEPSAELAPNQKDSDNLPPYQTLDRLVNKLVTDENISDLDFKKDEKIYQQILRNEFKRYQAPLGLKVTDKAFTTGRRYPLVLNLMK